MICRFLLLSIYNKTRDILCYKDVLSFFAIGKKTLILRFKNHQTI